MRVPVAFAEALRFAALVACSALVACGAPAARPANAIASGGGAPASASSVVSIWTPARAGELQKRAVARAPAVAPLQARRGPPSSGMGAPALAKEIAALEKQLAPLGTADPTFALTTRQLARDYCELERAKEAELAVVDAELVAARGAGRATGEIEARRARVVEDCDRAYERATGLYRSLAEKLPAYPELDEVLYLLAFEHEARAARAAPDERGSRERSRATYLELVKRFPQSRYLGAAFLAFGDLYFEEAIAGTSEWRLSIAAYGRALRGGPPPANEEWMFAQYKLGFAYWHTGERPMAIDAFQSAIGCAETNPSLRAASAILADAKRALDEL